MADVTAAEGGAAKKARKRSRGKHRKRGNERQNDAADDADEDQGEEQEEQEPEPIVQAAPEKTEVAPPAKRAKASLPVPQPQHEPEGGPKLSFYERVNPHKPSAKAIPSAHGSRTYTISIALPGSIVLNAQTPELQARLAGQIARTCAIFNVDEIVVFDEGSSASTELNGGDGYSGHRNAGYGFSRGRDGQHDQQGDEQGNGEGGSSRFDPNAFLARILQYLETPQYLRKALFPMHRDLRLAGLLPPLDCPHHLRFQDRAPYREGVVVDPSSASEYASSNNYENSTANLGAKKRKRSHHGGKVWVNVGLKGAIEVDVPGGGQGTPEIGTRVTVQLPEDGTPPSLVSPRDPTEQAGMYWGYTVRLAPNLGLALSDAPPSFTGGYDLLIGTSERGSTLDQVLQASHDASSPMKPFKHAIVVLGGLSGLEDAVERDEALEAGADEAHALFDVWVNLVEGQGSRTIRTEEALMIALARLKGPLDALGRIEKG
ncbi:hypothetical protein CF319_g3955 [Tilletia indica]|nr:hypothetical protein CF319_g3955 [Tilletia indica]